MRCIKEFASYRIREIENNEMMNPGIKNELIRRIDRMVKYSSVGIITPCEAMRALSNDCTHDGEDLSEYMKEETET